MFSDGQMIKWRGAVPVPLAMAAAAELCTSGNGPCSECVGEAAAVLAFAYAHNPWASEADPCHACRLVREDPLDLAAGCLFHQGVDQGIVSGFHPEATIEPLKTRSKRWWRWRDRLDQFWWAKVWTHDLATLAGALGVAVVVVAVYIGFVALLVK